MVEYILILLIKFFIAYNTTNSPDMTTRYFIEFYEEYDEVEKRISMVQKEIDALRSELAKLHPFETNTDFYMMIGLNHELDYHVRLMDSLLDHKAQAAKKLAILRQGKGDF